MEHILKAPPPQFQPWVRGPRALLFWKIFNKQLQYNTICIVL